jgi:hypothetical protein
MTQAGASSGVQEPGQQPAAKVEVRVTQCINARMHRDQPAGPLRVGNRAVVESSLAQLSCGHDSMLAAR